MKKSIPESNSIQPFWKKTMHLPDAKLLRVLRIERGGNGVLSATRVVLEDNSVWEILFEDAYIVSKWPPETTRVLFREGDRYTSSSYNTLLKEVNSGNYVAARRLQ